MPRRFLGGVRSRRRVSRILIDRVLIDVFPTNPTNIYPNCDLNSVETIFINSLEQGRHFDGTHHLSITSFDFNRSDQQYESANTWTTPVAASSHSEDPDWLNHSVRTRAWSLVRPLSPIALNLVMCFTVDLSIHKNTTQWTTPCFSVTAVWSHSSFIINLRQQSEMLTQLFSRITQLLLLCWTEEKQQNSGVPAEPSRARTPLTEARTFKIPCQRGATLLECP